ncbi:acyltransferase family protein [Blastococcus sp. TF02A-26]|uniref:acyltransferase family protein n=1 Tax=Blastococcus sp. TF02A-26 TaxID=2250577 RepID=UPI000DEA64AF|nr:acyltransferase family protein [Blastococcus sp. TF02A-26]RBY81034.1 acyltransferase [Blastococcus sp. TF02A-26]
MRGRHTAGATDEADPALTLPVTVEPLRTSEPAPARPRHVFRADIQGLRAVAVALVVLAHAGVPGLSGGFVGVDVFFVISGFLITQGLVRELEERGTVSLRGFYARRVRRILPAATVTLLAVAAATVLLLPQTRWLQIGREILTSALYVVNWDLAARSVDYSALGQAPSPLQHFWSLAVEEQFYLVWPLAFVLAGLLVRRLTAAAPSRRHVWLPLVLIAVPSLLWSVHLTGANPAPAYFVTTTRLWELALGAGLAVLPATLVLRGRPAQALQWVGLAAIAYAAVTVDDATPFPGSAALLPTLGAVAVLAGGLARTAPDENRLLSSGPMVWLGGLSYSLYLWHWPVLVIGAAVAEEELGTPRALLLVAASLVLAWLSLRLVEQPVLAARGLRRDSVRTLQVGAICMLVAVVAALGVQHQVPRPTGPVPAEAVDSSVYPGAAALMADPTNGVPVDSFPSIVPDTINAPYDYPAFDRPGCVLDWPEDGPWRVDCSFGDPDSETTVALIGDSHADHFAPAVERVAAANGWRLDLHTRSACPFVSPQTDFVEPVPSDCAQRNAALLADLLADPPDAVLIGTSRYWMNGPEGLRNPREGAYLMARGLQEAWAPLVEAGIRVIAMRDVPRPQFMVPDCIALHVDELSECAFDRAEAVWDGSPELQAAAAIPGVRVLDLTPWICPGERCPAVIGGIIVYRDTDHLTATYTRTLTGAVAGPLVELLGSD